MSAAMGRGSVEKLGREMHDLGRGCSEVPYIGATCLVGVGGWTYCRIQLPVLKQLLFT